MANKDDGLTSRPGDDPYELEWPDDAKEQRAADRDKAARAAERPPVPRLVAAAVIGLATALVCILPVAVAGGAVGIFLATAAPVVFVGIIVGFPVGWVLLRITDGMRRGVADVAFVLIGGMLGYSLTYFGLTALREYLFESAQDLEVVRSQVSLFMMTVTALAFYLAYFFNERLSRYPKQVYILGGFVVFFTILSVVANLFFPAS